MPRMSMGAVPTDDLDDIMTHVNEAFTHTKNWLISFICTSIIISLFIDDIISIWISKFQFEISELTVYSPERWLRMRWGSVMLGGFVVTTPYAAYLLNRFVKPGLLPLERKFIRSLIIFSTFIVCIIVPLSWYIFSPTILVGFSNNTEIANISKSYDISIIYSIVLGISWSIVITIISLTSQSVSGILFDDDNIESNPIKWRIHMITFFVLYLVLSGPLSPIWLPLVISITLLTHVINHLLPTKNVALIQNGFSTINDDGSINRVVVLDCSCEDSCPALPNVPNNAAVIRTKSVCLNPQNNEFLIQMLNTNQYSKLVVTGCSGTPMPKNILEYLDSKSIDLVGLSWLNQRGYHPDDLELSKLRREIQLDRECFINPDIDNSIIVNDPGWGRYIPRGYISLPQIEEF